MSMFGEKTGNLPDSEWRNWMYTSPRLSGYTHVEAYRPDGLFGWDKPAVIEVGRDPLLNVYGLYWRPAKTPIPLAPASAEE